MQHPALDNTEATGHFSKANDPGAPSPPPGGRDVWDPVTESRYGFATVSDWIQWKELDSMESVENFPSASTSCEFCN